MKDQIRNFIETFVREYEARSEIVTRYGKPLVGFADAEHPYILRLPELVGPSHQLPQDVLPGARTVIAYYVPFTKELAATNQVERFAAPDRAARGANSEHNATTGSRVEHSGTDRAEHGTGSLHVATAGDRVEHSGTDRAVRGADSEHDATAGGRVEHSGTDRAARGTNSLHDAIAGGRTSSHLASPEWARAYEETNAMFGELNQALIDLICGQAARAGVSPQATTFDQQKLVSDWSQRHFAYAAGLGTFGLNNMLLTRHGCCGRYSTVVTDLELEPDGPLGRELCLWKRNGSCGVCMKNCPAGALTPEGYDRFKCYEICRENAAVYTDFGSSYTTEDGTEANSVGSEVCGKCVTASPCAFWELGVV